MAAIRRCQSNDDIKRRRLAGPIRSEKSDYLTLPDPETDFINDPASSVGLDQVFRFQDLHRCLLGYSLPGNHTRFGVASDRDATIIKKHCQPRPDRGTPLRV